MTFNIADSYMDGLSNVMTKQTSSSDEDDFLNKLINEYLKKSLQAYLFQLKPKKKLCKQKSMQRARKEVKNPQTFSLRQLSAENEKINIIPLDITIGLKIKRLKGLRKNNLPDQVKMKPKTLKLTETPKLLSKKKSIEEINPDRQKHWMGNRMSLKLRAKKNLSGIQEENTEDMDDSFNQKKEPNNKNIIKPKINNYQGSQFQKIDNEKSMDELAFIDALLLEFDFSATTEIKKLIEKIRAHERDLESLFRLSSLILQNSKNLNCFEKCLMRIQEIDKEFKKKEISFALGKLNFMKGKWDKSLFYLKKNYNYSIKKDKALNYMVKILLKQKNYLKAKVACDKWIELSPGNSRVLYIKAKILYREHYFEEALGLFVKVVDQNINHYKALLYLGFIKHVWENMHQDAKVCFEGVVTNKYASSKFKSRAYYGLSIITQTENSSMALRFMRSAIKHSPSDWALKKTLAGMLVRFRKFKKAVSIYKSLLKDREEDLELLFSLGTVYMIQCEYLRAIKYFIRVIELSGKILEVRFDGLFANMFRPSSKSDSTIQSSSSKIFELNKENFNLGMEMSLKTNLATEGGLTIDNSQVIKKIKNPQSDFQYFSVNKNDINNSINKSPKKIFKDETLNIEKSKIQEFGEFGVFRSPKSKFANNNMNLSNTQWDIENSQEISSESIVKKMESKLSKTNTKTFSNISKSGPRILQSKGQLFKKFEDSSIQIFKSEFISNENSTSKVLDLKSDENNKSKTSEHLKVSNKKKEQNNRSVSRDSFSTLKGSMLSEIFCLDNKKKPVPLSKFSQKMKNNSKFIKMMMNKTSQSSFVKSINNSRSTFNDIYNDPSQKNSALYFFKSLIRLSKIFLEKLNRPKHCLKCLLFLEKNHQVDSSQINDNKYIQDKYNEMTHYLRVIGSSDSIEDYIRETKNKVNNMYSPKLDKTKLYPEQASILFFLLGRTYLSLQDHQKAEEKLILSHVYNKSNFESLFLLAKMNFDLKQYNRAERFYRKAYINNPSDNEALLGLADCNIRERNFDFLAQFSKTLDLELIKDAKVCLLFCTGLLHLLSKSNMYPTNHNKDMYQMLLKLLKKAESCLLSNSPRFSIEESRLRNQIAQKYFKIKEYQAGIHCLNHLSDQNMNPLTLYNLAYAHYKTGNLAHSMNFINKNLQIKNSHVKSLLLKAEISKKRGDLKTSQIILQKLIEKMPMDPVVNRMLGDVFKFKGSFFQAIEHYEVRSPNSQVALGASSNDKNLQLEIKKLKEKLNL